MGWALIRGWALINFFCLWDERLFEVGANSRLGAYSNKYGTQKFSFFLTTVILNYTCTLRFRFHTSTLSTFITVCFLINDTFKDISL